MDSRGSQSWSISLQHTTYYPAPHLVLKDSFIWLQFATNINSLWNCSASKCSIHNRWKKKFLYAIWFLQLLVILCYCFNLGYIPRSLSFGRMFQCS